MHELKTLAAPFPASAVKWKLLDHCDGKGHAVRCVDALQIMDRLDDVLGPCGWRDRYELLLGQDRHPIAIQCFLGIRVESEWREKAAIAPLEDIRNIKHAEAEAFKRAALKYGIFRYACADPVEVCVCESEGETLIDETSLPQESVLDVCTDEGQEEIGEQETVSNPPEQAAQPARSTRSMSKEIDWGLNEDSRQERLPDAPPQMTPEEEGILLGVFSKLRSGASPERAIQHLRANKGLSPDARAFAIARIEERMVERRKETQ
ncbi:hypothetical protein [Thioalkalivibrio thiocyanodenitrificans]|uniref:hypothetical protein n=1 Tax=Thioalkalivibrio thiocyanodenitrificans TaxID=243063 RepID=UPI00037EB9B9|nr:hypothetical protein [Thioalkalivibrio thiocyanodenitrificans]